MASRYALLRIPLALSKKSNTSLVTTQLMRCLNVQRVPRNATTNFNIWQRDGLFSNSHRFYAKEHAPLSDAEYARLSSATLEMLCEYFEGLLGDQMDISGYDCEYSSGVLTLKLGAKGTFVLNKQPPNKQIWLSSPISGPKRYDYDDNRGWYYERDQSSLIELLERELAQLLNVEIKIPR